MMHRGLLLLLCVALGYSKDTSDLQNQLANIRAALAKAEGSGSSPGGSSASSGLPSPPEHKQHKAHHESQSHPVSHENADHYYYASGGVDHSQPKSSDDHKQYSSGGSEGGSKGQSFDYKQYVQKYGGSQSQKYIQKYGGSQSGEGDFQQYMNKYSGGNQAGASGDYQSYINKYGGSNGGMSYQEYINKYEGGHEGSQSMGNYQQYMELGAGGGHFQGGSNANSKYYGNYVERYAEGDHGEAAGQKGDYQAFIKRYGGGKGNYQQYMELGAGGKNIQGDGEAHSGFYKQYLENYAHGGSKSGNYQDYISQYSGGSQSQAQAGDYKQYIEKYGNQGGSKSQSGDYQQYISKFAGNRDGSQTGDYQQYMQKYAGGAQVGSKSQTGNYQEYIQKYGGKQGSQVSGDYQNYIKNYASGNQANLQSSSGDYQQYINGNSGGSYANPVDLSATPNQHSAPLDLYVRHAKDAQNEDQLEDWKTHADNRIKDRVKEYVPSEYQHYANNEQLNDVEKKYKQRLSDLEGKAGSSSAPLDLYEVPNQRSSPIDMYVRHAKDAQSEDQLDDWKTHADERIKDRVKEYVPSEYQHYADKEQLNDVEKTYKQRLSDLEGKAGSSSAPLDLYEIPNQRYAPMDMYVRHAKDAQNEDQLDDWKTHAEDRVKEYVPSEYKHYADNDVEKKYKQRLSDLEGKAGSSSAPLGFLAGSNGANYDSASVAFLALFGVACTCVAFFATRNTRRVQIHDGLLG